MRVALIVIASLLGLLLALPARAVDIIWMVFPNAGRTITIGHTVSQSGGFDNGTTGSGYNWFWLRSHKTFGSAQVEDDYASLEVEGDWELGWNTTGLTSGDYTIIAYLETTWDMGETYVEIGNAGQGSQTLQSP